MIGCFSVPAPPLAVQVLKIMVGNNLKDTQLQQIVDKTILFHDKDNNGKINFEEFCQVFTALNCTALHFSKIATPQKEHSLEISPLIQFLVDRPGFEQMPLQYKPDASNTLPKDVLYLTTLYCHSGGG